jgi:hypothetical protein
MTVLAPVVVGRSLDPSSKSLMMGICIQRVLWVLWRLVKSFILGIDSIAGVPIRGGRLLVLQVLWVRRIPEIANPPLIVVQVLASVWRGKMLESWYVIDDPGNMLCGMISCLLVNLVLVRFLSIVLRMPERTLR